VRGGAAAVEKRFPDLTLLEAARPGMYGEPPLGGPDLLTIVQLAVKVGKDEGISEDELPQMTLEEIFSSFRAGEDLLR
jgi:hypothetical protein